MIRYIAVTDKDGKYPKHIPETAIEAIEPSGVVMPGHAEIMIREVREDSSESNNGYGAQQWRITGHEIQTVYSVMKFDDLIAWLNGIPRPLMLDIGPDEARHIKATLESTRRTLDSITIPGPRPVAQTGLDSDVWGAVNLLHANEWAEHWATTELGKRLESEITRLMSHDNEATNKLQRAEQLLAEIYHAVNNDGGLYPIGPDSDLVARLSEYLYPDPVAAMDRIGSQSARDILDE